MRLCLWSDAFLFTMLDKASRVCDFKPQELASIAWAFAKEDRLDAPLFAVWARAMERYMGNFNKQSLANIAWAFARAVRSDAILLAVVARPLEQRVGDFQPQGLVNIL